MKKLTIDNYEESDDPLVKNKDIKSILNKIDHLWRYNSIVYFFNRLGESLNQVIFWFPIIWKTRDFDYGYVSEMFELKMKRLLNFLSSEKVTGEQKEEDLLALKRCIEIISMLHNQVYDDVAYEEHYKKYPIKALSEKFINDPKFPNCRVMKPMEKDEGKSFRNATKLSEKIHSDLVKEFGNLFGKFYRNWWD